MKHNLFALKDHPNHQTPFRLAAGLFIQFVFWQVSRVIDHGRFDPAVIEIQELRLALPGLGPEFDGYRIAHISDIHMGTWMNTERLSGIVGLVNEQLPDLIAITGDFVSYTVKEPLQAMVPPLRALNAPDGVYAVLGNHDIWTDPPAIRTALKKCAIRELPNRFVTLERGGDKLHICGVDDAYEGLADPAPILQSLPEAGPAILLCHEPDYADQSVAAGRFALQLSGHSHGGQMRFPIIGPLYFPRHAKKYHSGKYRVGDMTLYTNRGLGTTALQMRINCPPEITIITLCVPA